MDLTKDSDAEPEMAWRALLTYCWALSPTDPAIPGSPSGGTDSAVSRSIALTSGFSGPSGAESVRVISIVRVRSRSLTIAMSLMNCRHAVRYSSR